jgi:hypothetical protein
MKRKSEKRKNEERNRKERERERERPKHWHATPIAVKDHGEYLKHCAWNRFGCKFG